MNNQNFNAEKICRLCMRSLTDSPKINIFGDIFHSNMTSIGILTFLKAFTSVRVHENDNFSHFICQCCLDKIRECYEFKIQCETTQTKLVDIWCGIDSNNHNYEPNVKVEVNDEEPQDTPTRYDEPPPNEWYPCKNEIENKPQANDLSEQDFDSKRNDEILRKEVASKIIKCPECDELFESRKTFNTHKRCHQIEKTKNGVTSTSNEEFKCEICGKIFPSALSLRGHAIVHKPSQEKNYAQILCNLCSKMCSNRRILDSHYERTHIKTLKSLVQLGVYVDESPGRNVVGCLVCFVFFDSLDALKVHIDQHRSSSTLFVCRLCKWQGSSAVGEHHISKHGLTNFTCFKCVLQFATYEHIERHFKSSNAHKIDSPDSHDTQPPTDFNCICCPTKFGDQLDLVSHLATMCHNGFECSQCHSVFSEYSKLSMHKRKFHPSVPLCPVCGKQFARMALYRSHVRHHRDRDASEPTPCPTCQKIFPSKQRCRIHMKRHQAKEVVCVTCGKQFTVRTELLTHMRSHTNERPFVCAFPDCGKSFKTTSHYYRHKKTHTDQRSHECSYCVKSFITLSELKWHLDLHLPTVYKCDLCDKTVKSRNRLKYHRKKEHKCHIESVYSIGKKVEKVDVSDGSKPIVCPVCQKIFPNKKRCRIHMKRHQVISKCDDIGESEKS